MTSRTPSAWPCPPSRSASSLCRRVSPPSPPSNAAPLRNRFVVPSHAPRTLDQVALRLGIDAATIVTWMDDEDDLKLIYQEQLAKGQRVGRGRVSTGRRPAPASNLLATAHAHKEREAADGLVNYIQATEQCKLLANRLVVRSPPS